MTRWTHGLINRLVILCDIVVILLATVASQVFWRELTWSQTAVLGVIGTAVYWGTLTLGQAYRVEHYGRLRRQIAHVLIGVIPASLAVLVVYSALVPAPYEKVAALFHWAGAVLAGLLFGRLILVTALMRAIKRRGLLRRDVVVIGDLDRAYAFVRSYYEGQQGERLLDFVAVFRDEGREATSAERAGETGPPMRGGPAELFDYARRDTVDMVVVTKSWADVKAIGEVARQLNRFAVDVMLELEPGTFKPGYANLTSLADHRALQVQQRPLKGSLGILKALEDYTVATLGLILVSPILLLAALAIKLDSPGPVLFRQARIGLNNREFHVYKLRTMHVNPADDGSIGAVRRDPRITRVGAILRSLSIDELPQLLNVLKGDMSVVGPRPHVPNMRITEDVRYEAISDYVARYRMKPGITGWAQINGMRGGIYTVEKAELGVELDLYYIEHWSIWFDIRILLLTITKGLADNSAF